MVLVMMRMFVPFLLFFVAGIYVWRNRSKMTGWVSKLSIWPAIIPTLLLAAVLAFLGSGFLWSLVLLPFAVLMSALLYRTSVFLSSHRSFISIVLATVGMYSFGIYLVHMLAISAIVNRLNAFGLVPTDALFYIVLLPAVVLVAWS